MALAGRDVQGRVAVGGGCVGVGHVLQQQLHDLGLPQPGRDVQGRLVFLPRGEAREGLASLYSTCHTLHNSMAPQYTVTYIKKHGTVVYRGTFDNRKKRTINNEPCKKKRLEVPQPIVQMDLVC